VGGLEDLRARVIRTIGDPAVRFREDPVRMLRAVAIAARVDFTIDVDTVEVVW
jgi:poly(A) polymerase